MRLDNHRRPWLPLFFMIIVGLVIQACYELSGWGWDKGIIREIGGAILITGLLGLTIDTWLKSEIAKDVFRAALGYVLPPEFRNEVAQIINYRFLSERHFIRVSISRNETGILRDDEVVRCNIQVERKVKNITGQVQDIFASAVARDWGFAEGESQINICEIEFNEIVEKFNPGDSEQYTKYGDGKEARTKSIKIPPGASVNIFLDYFEFKRANDIALIAFLSPTVGPEMEIVIPDEFEYTYDFGAIGHKSDSRRFSKRHSLVGTYFPGQIMSVRWWPKR